MDKILSAKARVQVVSGTLATLQRCGGYYECPRADGKRLGPLVGYAGRYKAADGSDKQFVGDVYANFAKAEEYPDALFCFACWLARELGPVLDKISVFCGAPLGGYSLAHELGRVWDRRVIKAEKKTVALATASSREETKLVFGRHELEKGDQVAIVEDVCNNFATTDQLIELVWNSGGTVAAIICLLNRSLKVEGFYRPSCVAPGPADEIPVIALVRKPIPEYRQDDPEVAGDIAAGNVVWKPKDEWARLMSAMDQHGL